MSLTNDTGTTMLVQPANTCGNDGGFGGNNLWWIILFILPLICGGMRGNNGNNGLDALALMGTMNGGGMNGGVGSEVQRGFDHSSVVTKLDGITQGICDSAYALNNTMTNGFHGVDTAICNLGYQTQQGFNQTNIALMQGQNALAAQLANCCCETREAIQGVNYNLATQACDTRNAIQNGIRDVIDNQNANSRAILDFLTNDKISTLQAENQSLKFAASQSAQNAFITANQEAQTAELIRRLGRDTPVPAYMVPNPNCCYGNYGLNYNSCGSCGC